MMGRKRKIRVCRLCGTTENVSRRNLCPKSREKVIQQTVKELQEKKGSAYQRWLHGLQKALEAEYEQIATRIIQNQLNKGE